MLIVSHCMMALVTDWTLWLWTDEGAEEVGRCPNGLRGERLTKVQGILVSVYLNVLDICMGKSPLMVAGKVAVSSYKFVQWPNGLTLQYVIDLGVVELLAPTLMVYHSVVL